MSKFNKWFLAQEKGKQKVLREDKWMLADNAFIAGKEEAMREIAEKYKSETMITAEQAVEAIST